MRKQLLFILRDAAIFVLNCVASSMFIAIMFVFLAIWDNETGRLAWWEVCIGSSLIVWALLRMWRLI